MSETMQKSSAHQYDMNAFGLREYPDRLVPWNDARTPDQDTANGPLRTGRLRACAYCGSMHPADVAEAIRQGAKGHWADFKYGWPHKAYLDTVPNPHAGLLEVRGSSSHPDPSFPHEYREPRYDEKTGEQIEDYIQYHADPEPAPALTNGKFYSVHLEDATPEDRAVIEEHLKLFFRFSPGGAVSWSDSAAGRDSLKGADEC